MSEYARLIGDDGNARAIACISKLIAEGFDPKRFRYRCIDNKCDVPVYPAVPLKFKRCRVKSPSPYFRAGSTERHKDNCQRDAIESDIVFAGGHEKHRVIQQGRTEVGRAPVKFTEGTSTSRMPSNGNINDVSSGNNERARRSGKGALDGVGASEPSSNSIERFAAAYENPVDPYAKLVIKIAGCPAKTYADTFLTPEHGATSFADTGTRHIYRGEFERYERWPSGTSVYFRGTANGRPLSVWISNQIVPDSMLVRLIKRIREAELAREARIYVLGTFVLKRAMNKYVIEITTPYQCWIYIPSP